MLKPPRGYIQFRPLVPSSRGKYSSFLAIGGATRRLGTGAGLSAGTARGLSREPADLIQKFLLVLKVPINGRETDIGDLVDCSQPLHQQFPDLSSSDFPIGRVGDARLHLVDQVR